MNREETIKSICKDKLEIISLKKASVKFQDSLPIDVLAQKDETIKRPYDSNLPLDTDTTIYRTIIANTYNYMDSHGDVHLNGLFSKSLQETKKIFFLHDHKFEVTAQIGTTMKAYEQDGRFLYFGYNSPLDTQALLLDVSIDKAMNELVFNQYKDQQINQHSVGMYYVKVDLAADNKQDIAAYELYHRLLPSIANADEVSKQGYFFAVSEAKLKEVSAVLMGSNPLTGVFDNNKSLVSDDQIKKMFDYLAKNVDNKEIISKLCKQYIDTYSEEPSKDTLKTIKPSPFTLIK